VFNRRSFKLKQCRVNNPQSQWIRARDAFEPLVARDEFDAVQEIISKRQNRPSDEEMLDALRDLLRERGSLTAFIIDETEGMPRSWTYRQRFGSLARAYQLVGASSMRDDTYIEINRTLRAMHPDIVASTIADIERRGGRVRLGGRDGRFWVNEELSLALNLSRCIETAAGALRWIVRFDPGGRPDVTIAVRMDQGNGGVKDYYLLPRIDMQTSHMLLREDNGMSLDAFRFDNLDYLIDMTARSPIRRSA
jgi:hypothetical protein